MSQTNEEQEVRLRDQFAIAAMQALLTNHKQFTTLSEVTNTYSPGSSNSSTYEYVSESNENYIKRMEEKIELISHLSYKIADQMRKARLATFL